MPKRSASAKPAEPAAKKAGATDSNEALAAAFDELKLYEVKAGGRFAGVTYDKVAKAIRAKKSVITAGSDLKDTAGVGASSIAKIDEFLSTGKIAKLEEHRSTYGELPPAVANALKSGAKAGAKGDAKSTVKKLPPATLKQIEAAENDFDSHTIDMLKALLRQNNGKVTGTKAELIARCAEGKVLGAFPTCPLCSGGKPSLNLKTGEYKCPGYMDDDQWSPCFWKGGEVERPAWKT